MIFLSEKCKKVIICYKTDMGVLRKENEDHFLVIDDRDENYDTLSMGMSTDLEAAIAEGATLVRIGTALFGERPRKP